jgi:hypothetical protein
MPGLAPGADELLHQLVLGRLWEPRGDQQSRFHLVVVGVPHVLFTNPRYSRSLTMCSTLISFASLPLAVVDGALVNSSVIW